MSDGQRLQINPDPIKIVPAAQRDVWFARPGWRCDHEDRRGRCTSRDTKSLWDPETRQVEHYCERHFPRS